MEIKKGICFDYAALMTGMLRSQGIPCKLDCYGSEEDKTVGHVFHVTITNLEAVRCNDDAAAFFKSILRE